MIRRGKSIKGQGIGVGIALGVALGAAMGNVGVGIALGIALGAAYDHSKAKETVAPQDEQG